MSDVPSPRAADPTRAALFLVAAMLAWQLGVERLPVGWSACVDPRPPQGGAPSREVVCNDSPDAEGTLTGPGRLLFGLPLDINREPAASLEHLPGIGPTRAAAIAKARCAHPFRDVESLTDIRGIGPGTLRRLRGLVMAGEVPIGSNGPVCQGASTLEVRTEARDDDEP